ncbi:MAG: iron dependent repressor, metal binding and dimerization domain protein, partial [Erysipelotrichaceae bacterium]
LELSKDGEDIAIKTYDRHLTLYNVLKAIGVSDETANLDACRMEHIISDETFNCLKNHIKMK